MLDKDAQFMLKAMETSGIVPGALFAEALPKALAALKSRVQVESNDEEPTEDEDQGYVDINTKAFPLIELLEEAIENDEKLLWDKG